MSRARVTFGRPRRTASRRDLEIRVRIGTDPARTVGRVAPHGNGFYWYAMGRNTAGTPVPTIEEAKAQAAAWIKKTVEESQ